MYRTITNISQFDKPVKPMLSQSKFIKKQFRLTIKK